METSFLTVSQLNRYIKFLIADDRKLQSIYVKGEISNFSRNYRSGHCYFTLKDSDAAVKAVMFKSTAQALRFDVDDGMSVLVRADASLYERDGVYQLIVSDIIPYGAGELNLAFEQLKAKLSERGLFDQSLKKPIPEFPSEIAVITSKTGAAVQDILNILRRRMPYVTVSLYPVSVQGNGSAEQIINALSQIQSKNTADEIIIARGGGSIEDLWEFNSEALAYAVFNCSIPVISAVGHETDFTICDFVADLRAPTPSAAAELAGVPVGELGGRIEACLMRINRAAQGKLSADKYALESVYIPKIVSKLREYIKKNRQRTEFLIKYTERAAVGKLDSVKARFLADCAAVEALNPFSVLKRGYSVVTAEDGRQVASKKDVCVGQSVRIKLKDGTLKAEITGAEE